MIDVFALRGTGEHYDAGRPTGMLKAVADYLDPARFNVIDVDYPASIGPVNPQGSPLGVNEEASIAAGVANLAASIHATPRVAGIIGYSLGALVASRLIDAIAQGQYQDLEIAFAGLVANPARPAGESLRGLCRSGYGIAGMRQAAAFPVYELANPDDGITACPPSSPLRTLSDQLSAFSFAQLGGWTHDLIRRLIENDWQPTCRGQSPASVARENVRAAQLMLGYLAPPPFGQHTLYATSIMPGGGTLDKRTYTQVLADTLNESHA